MITVNIPRPMPGTTENLEQINFIEPLRKDIEVNGAYLFNLHQFLNDQECSYSPGFKYTFRFINRSDAVAFILKFGGVILDD